MGNVVARWMNFKRDTRILMLGLDAAGKTTILYKFKLGDVVCTTPTIGFNVEQIDYRNLRMHMWDVGGQDRVRPLWRHYFNSAQALIFVVDSNDRERLDETREELFKILSEGTLSTVPLLVFANKQDLPHAMPIAELTDLLDLHKEKSRKWFMQSCSAVTGAGLFEGMDWLAKTVSK